MRERKILPIVATMVALTLVAGACGGDDKSAEEVADEIATQVSTALDDAQAQVSTAIDDAATQVSTALDDANISIPDVTMPDVTMPDVNVPEATMPPLVDANPAISALADLSGDDVCALIPAAEITPIVGEVNPEPMPSSEMFAELGTNCTFYGTGDAAMTTLVRIEFAKISWSMQAAGATYAVGDTPVHEPCQVGGREALCEPVGAEYLPPSVIVKLGSDNDIALVVSSTVGIEAATQVAELVLPKLPL